LTYISTDAVLKQAVDDGRLCHLIPVFPSAPIERCTLLYPSLLADLDRFIEAPSMGELRAALEAMTQGLRVTMGFTPYAHKEAMMGRLDPIKNGVWDYRHRRPPPGARVFGRFARQDVFVALTWRPRSREIPGFDLRPLDDHKISHEWNFAILEAEERWREALGSTPFVVGESVEQHFSSNASRNPDPE
jgi:hypothetical protein